MSTFFILFTLDDAHNQRKKMIALLFTKRWVWYNNPENTPIVDYSKIMTVANKLIHQDDNRGVFIVSDRLDDFYPLGKKYYGHDEKTKRLPFEIVFHENTKRSYRNTLSLQWTTTDGKGYTVGFISINADLPLMTSNDVLIIHQKGIIRSLFSMLNSPKNTVVLTQVNLKRLETLFILGVFISFCLLKK